MVVSLLQQKEIKPTAIKLINILYKKKEWHSQNSIKKGMKTLDETKKVNSNYSLFLQGYKNSKVADYTDFEAHKIAVRNYLNAHNREFKDIAPIKTWLSILNDADFAPRTTKKGNYSLFCTLQSIMKHFK